MDIEKYIYEIYHTGSLSKAVNNLFISQTGLSNAVNRYVSNNQNHVFT